MNGRCIDTKSVRGGFWFQQSRIWARVLHSNRGGLLKSQGTMCGITGLFLKQEKLQPDLGRLSALMLREMRLRGPDSAGFAVYGVPVNGAKLTLMADRGEADWRGLEGLLSRVLGVGITHRVIADHAVFELERDVAEAARTWLLENKPETIVVSAGSSMEIFKGVGDPCSVAERFDLEGRSGSHAITHTRMATESAVTARGSHPFSTGTDTCLAHNGSLSNHNQLRRYLRDRGEIFQTENDSEVAAGYLSWRMAGGDDLEAAMECALEDLDGFFTFAAGSVNGFAVMRDAIACKPAVIAETDEWVSVASEFRAIAVLPGVRNAHIWEPKPAKVYTWKQAS